MISILESFLIDSEWNFMETFYYILKSSKNNSYIQPNYTILEPLW
jgi:hypothetical protein